MSEAKYIGGQTICDLTARASIGDLSNLETTAKNTLVAAINEAAQSGGGGGSVGDQLYKMSGLKTAITFTSGAYINTSDDNIASAVSSPTSSGAWSYAVIDCNAKYTFYIEGDSGTGPSAYAFTDASYNVLLRNSDNHFAGNVVAPTGAKKLIINKKRTTTNESYKGDFIPLANQSDIDIIQQYYDPSIVRMGKDNVAWSWWVYPQVIHFQRLRNKVYWGFCDANGYIGVASYDVEEKTVKKNLLHKSPIVDDHNACAVYVYEDGTIICVYSTGHNTDKYIRSRTSDVPEDIDSFSTETAVSGVGGTCYSQLVFYNNTLYMFYRSAVNNWCYRYTTDKGATWSDEVTLITSGVQYYCLVRETTTSGVLRILMYSNPGKSDPAIRQAFLHLDTGILYDSDNTTQLGSSNISKDNVTVIIPVASGYNSQRLLDAAITDISRPLILYAPYTGSNGSGEEYKIYDAGTIVNIMSGGVALIGTYFLGCSWIGTNKIVVAHGETNNDVIDIYDYSNGAVSFSENICSESRGSVGIRNARPIVDINHDYILWLRGVYGNDYTAFNFDAKIHDLNAT